MTGAVGRIGGPERESSDPHCLRDAQGRLLVLRRDPECLTLLAPGEPAVVMLRLDEGGARRLRELLGRALGEEDPAALVRAAQAEAGRVMRLLDACRDVWLAAIEERDEARQELLTRRAEKEDDRAH
jgi:hypothetical protein